MRFGDYNCYALDLGEFLVDGGAMFGMIPKEKWEKKCPPDEKNRIRMQSRALLVCGNGRNILVDTGYGNKLTEEMKLEYGIDSDPLDMNLVLSGYDLDCQQITDVVLSHLHFDHAGGATMMVNHRAVPTFPNATYYIQEEQWEHGCMPHERDNDAYIKDDFLPLKEFHQFQLVNGSVKLCQGVELMVTYGHTIAQQHVVVKGENESLFFCADMVPTVNHIPVSWHMAFDNRPLDLFPEKDYFLRKAIRENWILFFQHDPDIVAARVKEDGRWTAFDSEVKFDD